MTEDEEIVFRVFEYGFGHAYKNRTFEDGCETMIFPRPCIIYLDEGKKDKIPDEYTLVLKFENQGEFSYKVPVFKLQSISMLKLVVDDIMSAIHKNEELGNLSRSDALDLIDLTTRLYMKIYSKYKEMEDFTMRMVDQSLELASDKYEKTVEELEDENTQLKREICEIKTLQKNNS